MIRVFHKNPYNTVPIRLFCSTMNKMWSQKIFSFLSHQSLTMHQYGLVPSIRGKLAEIKQTFRVMFISMNHQSQISRQMINSFLLLNSYHRVLLKIRIHNVIKTNFFLIFTKLYYFIRTNMVDRLPFFDLLKLH